MTTFPTSPPAATHGSGAAVRTRGAEAPDAPRRVPRMLLRAAALFVVMAVMWAAVPGVLVLATGSTNPFDNAHPVTTVLIGVPGAVLMLMVYRFLVRRLERRTVVELAPRAALGGLSRGALVGAAMFVTVVGVLAVLGYVRVTGTGPVSSVATATGLMTFAAVSEELIFRGTIFRLVESRLGTWPALVISAPLFGFMHLINNADATVWAATAITLEAGVLMAAAYAATRTLWVPIGLHFAWNLVGSLFGGSVVGSSVVVPPSVLTSVYDGPVALTGGGFGPEASVLTVALGALLGAVFLVVAAHRGNLRPTRRGAATSTDAR